VLRQHQAKPRRSTPSEPRIYEARAISVKLSG